MTAICASLLAEGLLVEGILMGVVIGLTLALLIWIFLPAFDAGQQTNQAAGQIGNQRWHQQQMSRTARRPAPATFGADILRNQIDTKEKKGVPV